MEITRKDAQITNTGSDEDFPGSFEVILSAPTLDRDGDTLKSEDWEQPLPSHITFDIDHGMSVASTVGSGVPTLENGNLVVRGTYSSLDRAQDTRTLVKEGHIRTTSVAFMTKKVAKAGGTHVMKRELLNGAFVAVPSNRDSLVLNNKGLEIKAGARNSAGDAEHIQAILGHAIALGATPPETASDSVASKAAAKYDAEQLRQMLADGHAYKNANGDPSYPIGDVADLDNAVRAVGRGGADHDAIRVYIMGRAKALDASDHIPDSWNSDGSVSADTESKVLRRMVAAKAVDGSFEQREQAISDALASRYPADDTWAYAIATFDDTVVYRVSSPTEQLRGQWQAPYTYDNGTVTLGDATRVNLVEQVVPAKSLHRKSMSSGDESDPGQLAQAVDAALDEGWDLIKGLDQTTLPEPLQQALGLFSAAGVTVDRLLKALGVADPDAPPSAEDADAAAAKAAAASASDEGLEVQIRAARYRASLAILRSQEGDN